MSTATQLKLIGVYRVSVSDEELRWIAEEVTLSMERALEEVGALVLIEMEVRGAPADFDLGRFHQDGSDQVPYDEKYFSIGGSEIVVDGFDTPNQRDFRVCFFLHYFDATKKIVSPYGEFVPTEIMEMPERLRAVCIYEHPG